MICRCREQGDYSDEVFSSGPNMILQIVTSIKQFRDLKNMTVYKVVGDVKTSEERFQGYGERGPSLFLRHVNWASRSK